MLSARDGSQTFRSPTQSVAITVRGATQASEILEVRDVALGKICIKATYVQDFYVRNRMRMYQ